jgi:hypothetical protein
VDSLVPGSEVEQQWALEVEVGSAAGVGVGGLQHACSPVVAGIVKLLAVDMDSTADNAVDMGHIQDTAGSTADIAVAVDTTVLQWAPQPVLQSGPG